MKEIFFAQLNHTISPNTICSVILHCFLEFCHRFPINKFCGRKWEHFWDIIANITKILTSFSLSVKPTFSIPSRRRRREEIGEWIGLRFMQVENVFQIHRFVTQTTSSMQRAMADVRGSRSSQSNPIVDIENGAWNVRERFSTITRSSTTWPLWECSEFGNRLSKRFKSFHHANETPFFQMEIPLKVAYFIRDCSCRHVNFD